MATYKKQSLLTINLETGYSSLGSATTKQILYKKPDGTKGAFTATQDGTKLVYNVANNDIDVSGVWQFQSYVVVGGLKGYGDVVSVKFDIPID